MSGSDAACWATGGRRPTGCSRRSWTASKRSGASGPTSRTSIERLESDIARYRDLETLLRKTLVSAERSAQELKEQARREADVSLDGGARRSPADQAAERSPSVSTCAARRAGSGRSCARRSRSPTNRTARTRPPRPPDSQTRLRSWPSTSTSSATLLEEERSRVVDAIEYLHKENPGSIEDETEDEPTDNHLAETATATLDREIDYTLEENSENVLVVDRRRARAHPGRDLRHVRELRQGDRRGAPRRDPVGDPLHRLQAPRGARLTEPVARNGSTCASARRPTR